MKNDSWEKIKDIFQAALDCPPEGREQFLSEACGGDDNVREEVRLLLSSFDEDEGFMESPAIGEVADTITWVPETLKKGKEIGRYRVAAKIGAGGMGEVFLAIDTELDRPVALKVLAGTAAGDDERVRRFVREAKAASALNHPNILTIYEIIRFENSHIIATEFIEGETLRQRQKRAPLSPSEVIDVALQIATALRAAHSAGIVHRDIKPENIMLRSDGLVKVLDFGLAKLTGDKSANGGSRPVSVVTSPGIVMGTVSYMAPEQVRGAADIDSQADIWSLGVVMFETLSGELPFTGGTTSDVVAAILTNASPDLTGDYPAELAEIVAKSLRKTRPERYGDIGDVIRDLKNVSAQLQGQTFRISPNKTLEILGDMGKIFTVPRLVYMVPVLLVAVALAGSAWWFSSKSAGQSNGPGGSDLKSVEILTWSSAAGESDIGARFSPDGTMIAFAGSRLGQKSIWIKQVASGEAIQVTRDEFANQNPIWSPDGTELAYVSNRGDQYSIWRIPVFGGSPTLIAGIPQGGSVLKSWSPGGVIYYNTPEDLDLTALDVTSLRSSQITDLNPRRDLALSPNAEMVAYLPSGDDNVVQTLSLKTGESGEIALGVSWIQGMAWHPDNRRIFFNAAVDDVVQIFETSVDGGPPKQITFADKDNFLLDVSPDGASVLYGSIKDESDIWAFDIKTSRELAAASGIDSELWASASPDGKVIAYQSVKNLGVSDLLAGSILTKRLGSDDPPFQLVDDGFLPTWSPNGRLIAFVQSGNGESHIKTINAQGGEQRQLTTEKVFLFEFTVMPYNRVQAAELSWSPDSNRIAYRSRRNGPDNIYIVKVDGSADMQLTQNTDENSLAFCPIWSPDGKQIAYSLRTRMRKANDKHTYSFLQTETDTGISKMIFQTDDFTRLIGWSPDGEDLILASGPGDERIAGPSEVNLFRVSPRSGKRLQIAALKDANIFNICLSTDRRRVFFTANQDGKENIWTIQTTGGKSRNIMANSDPRFYFAALSAVGDDIFYDKQLRYSVLSKLTGFEQEKR